VSRKVVLHSTQKYVLSEVTCIFERPVFIQTADLQRPVTVTYHKASYVFLLKAD
jgi:hypothetical protein